MVQDNYAVAQAACNLAEAYAWLKRTDEAETLALRSLKQEEPLMRPYALIVMGMVRFQQGRVADGEAQFADAIRLGQQNEDAFCVTYAEKVRADMRAAAAAAPESAS